MPRQFSAINGALTDVTTTATNDLGSIHEVKAVGEPAKRYKYVNFKNTTATVAGAAGSLVGYFAVTGYGLCRVVADMTDADAVPIPAGITLAAVTGTLATDYYCWIQISGAATLDTAVTSGAAGKRFTLTAGSTDKTGTVLADNFSPAAGVSLNTTTSVMLDCPE